MRKQIILSIIALLAVSTTAMAQLTMTFSVKGVSFEMIPVEGGADKHGFKVKAFCIGKTEVTQELWKAVMGKNPSKFKGDKRPVENVSWNDCQKFITKLNEITGQKFRLPTQMEWSFAACGGNYSHDYKYSGSDNIRDVAWYYYNSHSFSLSPGKGASGGETSDVATKKPNELGIYDMSGNVWEWTSSTFSTIDSSLKTISGNVTCGGGWDSEDKDCKTTSFTVGNPKTHNNMIGLRLAM